MKAVKNSHFLALVFTVATIGCSEEQRPEPTLMQVIHRDLRNAGMWGGLKFAAEVGLAGGAFCAYKSASITHSQDYLLLKVNKGDFKHGVFKYTLRASGVCCMAQVASGLYTVYNHHNQTMKASKAKDA